MRFQNQLSAFGSADPFAGLNVSAAKLRAVEKRLG